MVHPQGEVLSFLPLRYSRGEFPAVDLDRLAGLYRPLLPRPRELENVALGGPLLYHSTEELALPRLGSENLHPGRRTHRPRRGRPRLEVLELYTGELRPSHWFLGHHRYTLGLWAIGLDDLGRELNRRDRLGLFTLRLALLAAPIWKAGRKKRQFHALQMEHRQYILEYGLRHFLSLDYRYITPSGGALLLLDTLLWLDPLMGYEIVQAFHLSPHAQRNRNALYRRINWLFEKYPLYRRAGYKGGEPAYHLEGHDFQGPSNHGRRMRWDLARQRFLATSPYNLLYGGEHRRYDHVKALLQPTTSCLRLFHFSGPWLRPYQRIMEHR